MAVAWHVGSILSVKRDAEGNRPTGLISRAITELLFSRRAVGPSAALAGSCLGDRMGANVEQGGNCGRYGDWLAPPLPPPPLRRVPPPADTGWPPLPLGRGATTRP